MSNPKLIRFASLAVLLGAIAFSSIGAVSCANEHQPNACPDAPGDNCLAMWDAAIDAPAPACASDQDCTGSATGNICDTAIPQCVQCVAADPENPCTGTAPICGSADTCRACQAHSECSSNVCLADGSCDSGSDVAYLAAGGTGSACSQSMPCGSFATALATLRPYIRFSGSGTINEQVTINNQNVVILADQDAILSEQSPGTILTVSGTSDVTIDGLTITGGIGTAGAGVGISATGGMLVLERSMVSENVGGGISIDGAQFHFENTFVTGNGGTSSAFGGIEINGITTTGTYELDFDTIANNEAAMDIPVPGVACLVATQAVTVDSDIVYGNFDSGGTAAEATQLTSYSSGTKCLATYSDIEGSGSAGPDGSGNINANPLFVGPTDSPPNFHLGSGSPCINAGDPAATLDVDYDGDHRPANGGYDIGADEVP